MRSNISKQVSSLAEVASSYTLFLVDIAGVVYDGLNPYPGAVDALNALLEAKKTVLFLSNNPRPGRIVKRKLASLGVQAGFEVFTSGDLTRLLLTQTYQGQPIFHLGAARNLALTEGLELNLVEEVDQASLVLLTAFLEEGEVLEQFDPIIKALVAKKIPVLCANPDKIAMHGSATRRCAGTLAERIEAQGGEVIFVGKPDLSIYTSLSTAFPHLIFDKSQMLMVGDTLETDVLGGAQFGIDTFLVLTGNTGNLLRREEQSLLSYLETQPQTLKPTWFAEKLKA